MDLSVVVCTRNRAPQLAKALNHWSQLTPKASWELVLVDNGSTDATPQIIAEAQKRIHALRYVLEPGIGLGAVRDRGGREARGAIIAFTDDDCYPSAGYVDAFRRSPDAGYMGGRILLWDEDDLWLTVDYREQAEEIAPYRFVPARALQGANLGFRREALEKMGGPLHFVFIHGDHSEAGVRSDFRLTAPCFKIGGLIAFYDLSPNYPGVNVVVGEALASGGWQFASLIDSLGAIRRLFRHTEKTFADMV